MRQVTGHPSIHHHPFFFIPAYDRAMTRLVFVSHRTGSPQIFAETGEGGPLLQMTARDDLDEWSVYPSRDGRFVLFTAGGAAWRLDCATLEEVRLSSFGDGHEKEAGMVGEAMGTTALSWDDRWWAVPIKRRGRFHLRVIDTATGASSDILEREKIGHPQFCPDDPNLILYIGGLDDRAWVINRDGGGNRNVYTRDAVKNEWITHETWIPGTRELAFVDWPNGVRAIAVDGGGERTVARFNAWHAVSSWDGSLMVADTHFPDAGIQLFDPAAGAGEPRPLCFAGASQAGAHWGGPYPYAAGPVKVYAPQHTHPHPSFAPDRSRVVLTSDRSGHAQVYECLLPEDG